MYCPTCGAEANQGLNFCKRCGGSLSSPEDPSRSTGISMKLVGMFLAAIGAVTVVGLVLSLVASSELAYKGYASWFVPSVVTLIVLSTLAVDGLLVWLLLHLIKTVVPVLAALRPNAAAIPVLPSAPPVVGSVTEHTTRNFERVEADSGIDAGVSDRSRATR